MEASLFIVLAVKDPFGAPVWRTCRLEDCFRPLSRHKFSDVHLSNPKTRKEEIREVCLPCAQQLQVGARYEFKQEES